MKKKVSMNVQVGALLGQFLTPWGRREGCLYACEHLLFHKITKANIGEKEPLNGSIRRG